jgi:hypothetical protein
MSKTDFLMMVMDWLKDAGQHWLWGFLAGVLAFFSTWTISYAFYSAMRKLNHKVTSSGVAFGMACILVLLFIALVLLSHLWRDQLLSFYTTPLGPSLILQLTPMPTP